MRAFAIALPALATTIAVAIIPAPAAADPFAATVVAPNGMIDVGVTGDALTVRLVGTIDGVVTGDAPTVRLVGERVVVIARLNPYRQFSVTGLAPGRYRVELADGTWQPLDHAFTGALIDRDRYRCVLPIRPARSFLHLRGKRGR